MNRPESKEVILGSDKHAEYIADLNVYIRTLQLEIEYIKERLDPISDQALKRWRDECEKRDESSSALDSDLVAIMDRTILAEKKLA